MTKEIKLTRGKVALVDDENFEWLNQWKWWLLGSISGKLLYAMREDYSTGRRRAIYMHRLVIGAETGKDIDHINRNSLDNQRHNLRVCTRSQNLANRGPQTNNKSGYKGVSFSKDRNKWVAQISKNGKVYNFGRYNTAEEAALAYNKAAIKYHGAFAYLNNVEK